MKNKKIISNYTRFKELFKKGEQIVIGGAEWKSHGYIVEIDQWGFILTQLHKKNTIRYSWNCFEVIYHAGYKVTKESPTCMQGILELTMKKNESKLLNNSNKEYKLVNNKDHIVITSFDLKYKEIIGVSNRKIIWSRKGLDLFFADHYWHLSLCNNEKLHYTLPNTKDEIIVGGVYGETRDNVIYSDENDEYDNHYFSTDNNGLVCPSMIENNKELSDVREKGVKIEERSVYSGDPYHFEGIEYGFKTWKSENGFIMTNAYADVYCEDI